MRPRRRTVIFIAIAGALFGGVPSILKRVPGTKFIVYAGTKGKGIYAFRFDASDGSSEPLGMVSDLVSVSSLALHPQNRLMYAVSEVKDGLLSGFAVNPSTGALRLLASVPSLGEEPCHVMVDSNGWMIVVTNCGSGSVVSYRVGGDGAILESPTQITNRDPKQKTHPQQMVMSPDHFFLFGPDAGIDKIFFYRFDPARVIFWPNTPASLGMKAGSTPGGLVFRPDGRYAYLADETASRITALRYDKVAGTLTAMDGVSTILDGFAGKNCVADIHVDGAGKFLYAANKGDDSVVVYAIQPKTGALANVQRVPTPGNGAGKFAIEPTGRYLLLANQDSGTIAIFEIDRKTGMVTFTGKTVVIPAPSALLLVPVSA